MRDAAIRFRNGPNAAPSLASLGNEIVIRIDHQKGRDLLVVCSDPVGRPVATATLCASLSIELSIWMPISITFSEAARSQAAAPTPQPLSGAQ